jgi:hypothetical protein
LTWTSSATFSSNLSETSNARLEELRGQRTLFDLDRQILQHNLYGVDLNAEAIQIRQLSLWIKTAGWRRTWRRGATAILSSGHQPTDSWQGAKREAVGRCEPAISTA